MAKVTRPILTGVFPRKRLFAQLDRMRKLPVIWVSGPPGCGKTTLVSSYLEARQIPCLWYQIDAGDADPATFFYYLGQAAQRASPRKRKPLPLLTPEYLQGLPTFTLRYFEELYNRLNPPSLPLIKGGKRTEFRKGGNKGGAIAPPPLKKGEKGASPAIPPFQKGGKGGFILVFDNYQEVPSGALLHEIIL